MAIADDLINESNGKVSFDGYPVLSIHLHLQREASLLQKIYPTS